MAQGFGKARGNGFALGDKRRLIALAGAVFVACLASVVVIALRYRSQASASGVREGSERNSSVLIAEKRIVAGQDLGNVALKEVLWPVGELPEGAVRDRTELKGMFVKADVVAGVPLLRANLTQTPPTQSLQVTPGNRAVTIEVDAISGIEGLALPGTRVDVVLTYSPKGELTSKIIVQNARVLAAGGRTKLATGGGADGEPDKIKTVTLDVSTQDALGIQTSSQLGRLSLIMRAGGSNEIEHETEFSEKQIGGSQENKEPVVDQASLGCKKGYVRIGGKDFQLNCDGSILQVEQSDAP